MKIYSIGTYPQAVFKANVKPELLNQGKNSVAELAKKELANIEAQGKVAGTDAAWWRSGFQEAKAALESIVKGEELPHKEQHHSIMRFHDFDDDGFI